MAGTCGTTSHDAAFNMRSAVQAEGRGSCHRDRLVVAFLRVPKRRSWRRTSWDLAWPYRPSAHPSRNAHEATPMRDESGLREKARAAVRNGKIPSRTPDRTWGGPGVGAICAICDLPVERTEMEFEIQFARDGDNPGLDKFHVHIRCFAAWEFDRRGGKGGGSPRGPAALP